jgi:hypothetical protein
MVADAAVSRKYAAAQRAVTIDALFRAATVRELGERLFAPFAVQWR